MNEIKAFVFRIMRRIVLTAQNSVPSVDTTGIVLYSRKNAGTGRYELYFVDDSGTERHVTFT